DSALQRHQAVEKNNDGRQRQIKCDYGEQPENGLVIAELGGPTDPNRANYKNDLRENEIEETEFLLQHTTTLLNGFFKLSEWGRDPFVVSSQEASWRFKPLNLKVRKVGLPPL